LPLPPSGLFFSGSEQFAVQVSATLGRASECFIERPHGVGFVLKIHLLGIKGDSPRKLYEVSHRSCDWLKRGQGSATAF
jgi:hypothetical protein